MNRFHLHGSLEVRGRSTPRLHRRQASAWFPRRCLMLLPLTTLVSLGSGCIAHSVRITPPPNAGSAQVLVGSHRAADPHAVIIENRPQPVEVRLCAYQQTASGLARANLTVRSPRSWWQRFPIDIVTDLLPMHFTASTQTTFAYQPITPRDESSLTQEARNHGFAHDRSP